MRSTYILLFVCAVLVAGCGTTRRATVTPAQPTQPTAEQPKKILYPSDYDPQTDYIAGAEKPASAGASAYPAFDIEFRPIETQHVKISGVNPLPESGVLEVDLDKLRGEFRYPYKGEFLSDYGWRGRAIHTGVDIRTVANDTVRAALPGVVRMSKLYSGYGNIVVIRHYCGFETVYAHFSKNLVKVGERVDAGTPIGLGGSTGRATTDHLHFEVRAAGQHVDPKKLLDIKNQTLQRGKLYFESSKGELMAYSDQAERAEIIAKRSQPAAVPAPAENAALKDKPDNASSASGTTAAAQYHTVKSGDTLYGMALKYKTTVKKLCQLNGITEKAILQLNQKIRVR